MGVYVDDIVIACKSDMRLKEIKQDLCKKFNVGSYATSWE